MESKERLTLIDEPVALELIAANDLGKPHVIKDKDGRYWANADEVRAWKASQSTSGEKA